MVKVGEIQFLVPDQVHLKSEQKECEIKKKRPIILESKLRKY